MTSILPASSLTADISDTNQLLDDLLHQLALHTDYTALKQLKHTYTHIQHQQHVQHTHVKQLVHQLTSHITTLQQQLAASDLDDARHRHRTTEAAVKDSEARVAGLRDEERVVRSEVDEKVDETKRLEQQQHDMLQRHTEAMTQLKSPHDIHTRGGRDSGSVYNTVLCAIGD